MCHNLLIPLTGLSERATSLNFGMGSFGLSMCFCDCVCVCVQGLYIASNSLFTLTTSYHIVHIVVSQCVDLGPLSISSVGLILVSQSHRGRALNQSYKQEYIAKCTIILSSVFNNVNMSEIKHEKDQARPKLNLFLSYCFTLHYI